jgi:hypothetical protein
MHSAHSFIHSFILSFLHSFCPSFIHSVLHIFIHSFISPIHSFISPIHSFCPSFIHLFIHSVLHSCIYSFITLFIHSFKWSVIKKIVNPCSRQSHLQNTNLSFSNSHRIINFHLCDVYHLSSLLWTHQGVWQVCVSVRDLNPRSYMARSTPKLAPREWPPSTPTRLAILPALWAFSIPENNCTVLKLESDNMAG